MSRPLNLVRSIAKLDIDVKLGQEVTTELVQQLEPEVVIVATGSIPLKTGFVAIRPDLPGIPGADQENVVTVFDVLQETVEVGDNVVLVDDEGHQRATSAAEFLADRGKRVEIITRFPSIAFELSGSGDQAMFYQRLPGKGVTFSTYMVVREIRGNTVVAYTTYNKAERCLEGVDTIVLAMGNKANNGLYRSLKGQVSQLHAVGDCVEPRRVADAIYEGHMAALNI